MKPIIPILRLADLERLDRGGCMHPGCHHDHGQGDFYLTSACHTGKGVEIRHKAGSTRLLIACRFCHLPVCEIEVAP